MRLPPPSPPSPRLAPPFNAQLRQIDNIIDNYITEEEFNETNRLNDTILEDLIKVRDECKDVAIVATASEMYWASRCGC
ncbi:hypothetical protein CYMTET_9985 [Cymbomonas tetramitiformis]|uniref:Uncharacterized protein n=1 Tax=Cymbomonas tetramitiformis TaxID=36881 RepID=A0AAE0LEA3_9CHLO|nr:hypothetical protein CYMTET_9985 [Cymbomonas tetramitiformis]